MVELSEFQLDAVTELLNIGMGKAAVALSEMVEAEVELAVPSVQVLSREQILKRLKGEDLHEAAAVRQQFEGLLNGAALLLFPEAASLELVHCLMTTDAPVSSLTEMEQEALAEVGNVLINCCLASFADAAQDEISSDLPEYAHGSLSDIVLNTTCAAGNESVTLFLRAQFSVAEKNIAGYVGFILDLASLVRFAEFLETTSGA